MTKKCKKTRLSSISQDVYLLETIPAVDIKTKYTTTPRYRSFVQNSDGTEHLAVFDYPITPASVKSAVGSTDYKRDINQTVVDSARVSSTRTNLGDITELQRCLALDSSVQKNIHRRVCSACDTYRRAQTSKPTTTATTETKNE